MSIVTLVSGGIDSSLMAVLTKIEGIVQSPLFINYGQLGHAKELAACRSVLRAQDLPAPVAINVAGFGRVISSGLTDKTKDIFADAFLPGRNLLFLLLGAAYAYQVNANAVAIGLLNESASLFPDQTREFLIRAEEVITICLGRSIRIIAPLRQLFKADVIKLAKKYGITGTYSCHSGEASPCGKCVSCREVISAKRREQQ